VGEPGIIEVHSCNPSYFTWEARVRRIVSSGPDATKLGRPDLKNNTNERARDVV
jgi:hypothetical protein